MRIGFIGDTHCSVQALSFMLWRMRREGITEVVSVGDFGIYSDRFGEKFRGRASKLCKEYGITLYIVPGNHENWQIINDLTGDDRTSWAPYSKSIFIAPRGLRWEWGGMSFVALGGAPSVDRGWRVRANRDLNPDAKNKHWYPEEALTDEDVAFVSEGGYADVMVGHDAPRGVPRVDSVIAGNPMGFLDEDLAYADIGRGLMNKAFHAVAPSYFFHGHYHVGGSDYVDVGDGRALVTSLAHEMNNYSMAVLDTEDGSVTRIDHNKDISLFRRGGS